MFARGRYVTSTRTTTASSHGFRGSTPITAKTLPGERQSKSRIREICVIRGKQLPLEEILQPGLEALGEFVHRWSRRSHRDSLPLRAPAAKREAVGAVLYQADHGREPRRLHRVGQSAQ